MNSSSPELGAAQRQQERGWLLLSGLACTEGCCLLTASEDLQLLNILLQAEAQKSSSPQSNEIIRSDHFPSTSVDTVQIKLGVLGESSTLLQPSPISSNILLFYFSGSFSSFGSQRLILPRTGGMCFIWF